MGFLVMATATAIGFLALFYPFIFPFAIEQSTMGSERQAELPLMMTILLGLCLVTLIFEAQGRATNVKNIALLGVLVAINSTLRFIEVGIPGPAGFSPIFFLIILGGYVFGSSFGFLMGALTMLVSAMITGGMGPWLPAQMFTAGWVGLSAAILRPIPRYFNWVNQRTEIFFLCILGFAWGFLFGAVMNLWTWPFLIGQAEYYYTAGIGWWESITRYLAYYMITSFLWDLAAAIGNAAIFLIFGSAALKALRRFHRRFSFIDQTGGIPASREPAL
jgi:energy-coupling factor transport system substrate-specific component